MNAQQRRRELEDRIIRVMLRKMREKQSRKSQFTAAQFWLIFFACALGGMALSLMLMHLLH